MLPSNVGPVPPRRDEALNLFGSMFCALTYGTVLTLYCICTHELYRRLRKPGPKGPIRLTLAYTTFAIVGATLYLGLSHYLIQMAYVFHRDFPGGPLRYEGSVLALQTPYSASLAIVAVMDWLTLGIQIWRLWILWRTSRFCPLVIAIPICLYLACIGVGIASVDVQVHINHVSVAYNYYGSLAFFGVPPLTTSIITALMISRLMAARRRHVHLVGDTSLANQYMGVIAMLVESYALDTVWSIATIITYAFWAEPIVYAIFIQAFVNVKVIAMFLIVYRVAKGKAWQAHTEQQLSSLRWNYGVQSSIGDPSPNVLPRENNPSLA